MTKNNAVPFSLIVPAAGIGQRAGGDVPKQYQLLAGKTVLEQTLEVFLALPGLQQMVVALHPEDKYFSGLSIAQQEKVSVVEGGAERANSVYNGLCSLQNKLDNNHWVLVHDAARPCVLPEDIESMLLTLGEDETGGIMAMPASDTIKSVSSDGRIKSTQDRNTIWQAQTPQMFRFGVLFSALKNALENDLPVTDESSAVEALGYQPKVFQGKRSNIKITLPEDMGIAEQILENRV